MVNDSASIFVLLCLATTGCCLEIGHPLDFVSMNKMMDSAINPPQEKSSTEKPTNQTTSIPPTVAVRGSLQNPLERSNQELKDWLMAAKLNISVVLSRNVAGLTKGIHDVLTRAQGFWTSLPGYLQTVAPFIEIAILLFILLAVIVMARKVGNYMKMVRRVTRNASVRRQEIPMHRL